jgi:hypothetical protein
VRELLTRNVVSVVVALAYVEAFVEVVAAERGLRSAVSTNWLLLDLTRLDFEQRLVSSVLTIFVE